MSDPGHSWPALIVALMSGESQSAAATAWAMGEIMDGAATDVQVAGYAVALRSNSGQASSILERTKEDGPALMADSAIRVVTAHLSAAASGLIVG